MIARHDHQRLQDHLLIASAGDSCEDIFQVRLRLDGTDIVILHTLVSQDILHLRIDSVGLRFRSVSHEADSGLPVVIVLRRLHDGVSHRAEILVRGEQRLSDHDLLKAVGVLCDLVLQIRVLQSVHQVGRLDHQGLHAVLHCAVQCLPHVVNNLPVPLFHVVDDDLAGECAADAPVRECFLQGFLDGADGLPAAVVEAGSEAHHQQFLLPDVIPVPRIVQGSIAGIVVFFFLFLRRGRLASGLFNCGLRRRGLRCCSLRSRSLCRLRRSCRSCRRSAAAACCQKSQGCQKHNSCQILFHSISPP